MAINKTIGGNRNRSDKANKIADIALNTSTATTLVAEDEARIFFSISNTSSNDVWLQFNEETDGFENAIYLPKKSYWEMHDNLYFGEIKAIAVSGSPTVTIMEY